MQNHFKLSDSEFKRQFILCQLKPEDFSHEAHIRLAWINITEHGIDKAIEEIQNQIKYFINFIGEQAIYNTTVTIAAMKIVYHFMKKSENNNFKEFIFEFPQLNSNFKGLLSAHYSQDIFSNPKAKKEFIKPDLQPFEV